MKTKISRILGVGVTLALVTSLLVGVLPALALGTPVASVAAGQNIISQVNTDYTVRCTVDQELGVGDVITITFPSDTAINVPGIVATIQAEDGWIGGNPNQPAQLANVTWGGSAASRTITATLAAGAPNDEIGEGAEVRIVITAGITNPTTPGDYTLTFKTTQEPTATTSNVYTIIPPSLYYPGTVEVWNPGGYLMNVGTSINAAIGLCTAPGYTIMVGSGYYDEAVVVNQQVTIQAMEGATPIIADLPADAGPVSGNMTIQAAADKTAGNTGVMLDGLTFMGDTGSPNVLMIAAEGVTVQNCSFTKAGSSVTTPSQTMISFTAASPNYPSTITECDFDLGLGSINDIGVDVFGNWLTVSNCTFAGDGAGAPFYTQDYYIQNWGGTLAPYAPTRSTGNTGTGSFGGTLIYTPTGSVGVMTSTNDTMTGLWRALRVYGGRLTVTGASISGCGIPASATLPLGIPAVDIADLGVVGTTFTMNNSSVSNSYAYAFSLGTSTPAGPITPGNVNVMFNKITDNAKNVYSLSPAAAPGVNFTHNWWGDPDGPVAGSMGYLTSSTVERVDTRFPLGAPGTGDIGLGTATYTSAVTGTTVTIETSVAGDWWAPSGFPSAAAQIGSALYESNPAPVEPMYPVLEDGYLDIFIGTPGWPTDIATITIPNDNIDANTVVEIWNPLVGDWQAADQQGVNMLEGTLWFLAGPSLWPEANDMGGTAVALVTAPAPALAAPAQTSLSPAQSATGVSTTLTSFSWDAVAGAESYNFQLAPYFDVVDPFQPAFIILETNVPTNGVILVNEELDYYETYAWRVQAVRGTDTSAWVTSFFVTEAEPEEAPDPIEIVIPEPTPTPEIEVIVPAPTEVEVVPEYLLWVIVGVAAVLVIAVIVLIVRTRRVA